MLSLIKTGVALLSTLNELNLQQPIVLGLGCPPPAATEKPVGEREVKTKNLNLTSFKLGLVGNEWSGGFNVMPFVWNQLFQHFPNLQDLRVDSSSHRDWFVFNNLFKSMAEASRTEGGLKIKCLHFKTRCQLSPETVALVAELFTSRKLSFESVSYDVAHNKENSLHPIVIQHHGPALKAIEVSNKLLLQVPYISFPLEIALPNLTKLKLCSTLINTLDFLDYTPNLRVLSIKERGDSASPERGLVKLMTDSNLQKLEGVVLQHLSKFLLPVAPPREGGGFELNPGHIEALARCMPNLKELNVPVTTEGLRVICLMWTDLRQLCVQHKHLTDEGITGICGDSDREERLPNITNLKYLEGLFLNSERLSDASIFQGFFQLPNLKRLAVTMSNKTSVEGFRALRQKFPSIRVTRVGVRTRGIQNKDDFEMDYLDVRLHFKCARKRWSKNTVVYVVHILLTLYTSYFVIS